MPEAGGGSGGGGGWINCDGWLVGPIRTVNVTPYIPDGATSWYAWPSTTSTTGGYGGGGGGNLITTDFTTLTWQGQRLTYLQEDEDIITAEDREIERAAATARAQYLQEEREQRRQERVLANARSKELLLSLLDENQREAYQQDEMFAVVGSHGTVYRISRGTSGNVEWIKPDGTFGGRLCAHPSMRESWLPTEDVMLAQVLALKTDEREFVRVANVHAGQRPPILESVAA